MSLLWNTSHIHSLAYSANFSHFLWHVFKSHQLRKARYSTASFDLWIARKHTVIVQGLNYNTSPPPLSWLGSHIGMTACLLIRSDSHVCAIPFLWGEWLFFPSSHLSTPCSITCPGQKLCNKALLATVDGLLVGSCAKLSSQCLTPHFGSGTQAGLTRVLPQDLFPLLLTHYYENSETYNKAKRILQWIPTT